MSAHALKLAYLTICWIVAGIALVGFTRRDNRVAGVVAVLWIAGAIVLSSL